MLFLVGHKSNQCNVGVIKCNSRPLGINYVNRTVNFNKPQECPANLTTALVAFTGQWNNYRDYIMDIQQHLNFFSPTLIRGPKLKRILMLNWSNSQHSIADSFTSSSPSYYSSTKQSAVSPILLHHIAAVTLLGGWLLSTNHPFLLPLSLPPITWC